MHVQVVLSKRATYDISLLDSICVALSQAGLFEKAGELYEQQRRFTEAQMAYRRCVTSSAVFTAASAPHSGASWIARDQAYKASLGPLLGDLDMLLPAACQPLCRHLLRTLPLTAQGVICPPWQPAKACCALYANWTCTWHIVTRSLCMRSRLCPRRAGS